MVVLDWNQLGAFIGISAIVSGLVSSLTNYLLNINESKRTSRMNIAEDRLHLYSYLIFQLQFFRYSISNIEKIKNDLANAEKREVDQPLDKAIKEEVAERQANFKKLDAIFEVIDSTIQQKLHLLTPIMFKKWLDLKKLSMEINKDNKKILTDTYELIQLLINEYGDFVLKQYKKSVGRGAKYLMDRYFDYSEFLEEEQETF